MKKILTLLLLVIAVQVLGQTYPVTGITISLPANPDANMANWGSGTSLFTITANAKAANGRVDGRVTESKILVNIKKGGVKVCGSYTGNTAPGSNFNTLTKVWSGSNAVSLLGQGCVLPAGEYELTVQFFGTGPAGVAPFSEEKIRAFSIRGNEQQIYQPPQAISPANGTLFSEPDIKKPITFRWTPVIPRPREPITYRLRVWQLMQGQNGVQAMRVNQPIITKDVDNLTQTMINNLISGPCLSPYLCDFIWNVQALNREGKPIGGNNGLSELITFKFSPEAEPVAVPVLVSPANQETIPTGQQPKFTWLPPMPTPSGEIIYKIKIVEIIGDQSPEVALRTNKPHFEKDSLIIISFQYPSSAKRFTAGKKYGWNVSIFDRWGKLKSSTASVFIASSCDVNLTLKLRSVECLPDSGRNKRYKIGVSATYSSAVYNLTYANSGSGFKAYHPSYTPNYTITNISPGLQVQNSGLTTTKTYSFEVSVPIGQTAIKVGLQGDDKDPGPITCQPGAELDLDLPACNVNTTCDCGKWGPLIIDGEKYECGSKITWNCKKPFEFTSSYQCSPNNESCQAKTTWEVRKGDTLIKSGTGNNTLSDGVSLMSNGTYTLTLNSTCNGVKCEPCIYTIVVENCGIAATCDCGTWNPLEVDGKKYDCGSRVPWNCKRPFQFVSSYQCKPNGGDCLAKLSWEVKLGNIILQSGTGSSSGAFTPIANGIYTITLNASCNGIRCKSCIYTVVVEDCNTAPPPPPDEDKSDEDKSKDPVINKKAYYSIRSEYSGEVVDAGDTLFFQIENNYSSGSNQLSYTIQNLSSNTTSRLTKLDIKNTQGLIRIALPIQNSVVAKGETGMLILNDSKKYYYISFKRN